MKYNVSWIIIISLLLLISCTNDSFEDVLNQDNTLITFSKNGGSDPSLETNQDRITDNVWITRGNDGGQIYNAVVENTANKDLSPIGTEWAEGTLDNLENLSFDTFRNTTSPQEAVGKNLVMHLIEDELYIQIKFISWDTNREGGFIYQRSQISQE